MQISIIGNVTITPTGIKVHAVNTRKDNGEPFVEGETYETAELIGKIRDAVNVRFEEMIREAQENNLRVGEAENYGVGKETRLPGWYTLEEWNKECIAGGFDPLPDNLPNGEFYV